MGGYFLPFIGQMHGLSETIPSDTAKTIVKQLIKRGYVKQGFLGGDFDEEMESMFDVYCFESFSGAEVKSLLEQSPAKCLLQKGDLIVGINGHKVRSPQDLRNRICILEPGTNVTLQVMRDGNRDEVEVPLGSEKLSERYADMKRWSGSFVF